MDEINTDSEVSTINACIQHAREVLTAQLALVKDKGYDFSPEFKEMTVQLYLLGVIWRCAESQGAPENARDTAFSAIEIMFISKGMQKKKAAKRVDFLKRMSRAEDGSNALAVAIGYESEPGVNSLAQVFDHYVDDVQVSGAFWRLYDRGKKTMLYGGLFVAFVVIWLVTLFLPGNSAISILAAGLVSAALFVIPAFLIGLLIYRIRIKKAKRSNSS